MISIAMLAIVSGTALMAQSAAEGTEVTEPRTGVAFAEERIWRADRYRLAFVGRISLRAIFFDVTACALAAYAGRADQELVEHPSQRERREYVAADHPKMLVLHMVRRVGRNDLQDFFREYIRQNISSARENDRDVEHLVEAIPAVRKGDELQFVWRDGELELAFEGESRARSANEELAEAIWSLLTR